VNRQVNRQMRTRTIVNDKRAAPAVPDQPQRSHWTESGNESQRDDLLDTAILYRSLTQQDPCLCRVSLRQLVNEWHGGSYNAGVGHCPVCDMPVQLVEDAAKKEPKVVFKYGKQMYRLSVSSRIIKCSWWKVWTSDAKQNKSFAQERIADALGMSLDEGIKILYKGKRIFPQANKSNKDISQELITISEETGLNSKSALLVMGTLKSRSLSEAGSHNSWWTRILFIARHVLLRTGAFAMWTVQSGVVILKTLMSSGERQICRNGRPRNEARVERD
jgi:hypothetical protein